MGAPPQELRRKTTRNEDRNWTTRKFLLRLYPQFPHANGGRMTITTTPEADVISCRLHPPTSAHYNEKIVCLLTSRGIRTPFSAVHTTGSAPLAIGKEGLKNWPLQASLLESTNPQGSQTLQTSLALAAAIQHRRLQKVHSVQTSSPTENKLSQSTWCTPRNQPSPSSDSKQHLRGWGSWWWPERMRSLPLLLELQVHL